MYSNRVVYDETLLPKKSTNGRYVRWQATSGDTPSTGTPVPIVQTIQFNNIQATSRKNIIKDIRFNGTLIVKYTTASADDTTLELIADINRFIDINCTINGTCNYITNGFVVEPVFKSYIDEEVIDQDLQSYYQPVDTYGKPATLTDEDTTNHSFKINFSVKLMHPFLFTDLGGLNALNIVITTNPGLLGLFKITATKTISACAGWITNASITYVEYEGASETFIKKVGYMVQYYNTVSSPNDQTKHATAEANTRNVSGAPLNVYQFVGINGSAISSYDATRVLRKPLPITTLTASINNNVNAYNAVGTHEMYGRSRELGYQGQLSDFTSSYIGDKTTKNEMGCVVKISNRMLPININTGEIYRYSAQVEFIDESYGVNYDAQYLYLMTVYEYPALLYLSPEKNTCEYIVNQPVETVGDYIEDDLYNGSGFFDFIKKGFNWLKDKKIISNGARILSSVLPGKAGGIASVVGNVADTLGMSTSVF